MKEIQIITGPTLGPDNGTTPEQLVILLHGVGSNGDDLIGLAPFFQKILPGALFVSPNAPQAFDMAPAGMQEAYQWFSLQDMSPEARLAGTQTSAPILDAFIDEKLAEIGLTDDKLALVGFSQGTMMSLYVGPRRANQMAGIIGYSGMLIGAEMLADSIKSRPPVLVVHGDADEVVPVDALTMTVEGLKGVGIDVRHHISPGLGHGLDDAGIRLGMEFLANIFGIDLATLAAEGA